MLQVKFLDLQYSHSHNFITLKIALLKLELGGEFKSECSQACPPMNQSANFVDAHSINIHKICTKGEKFKFREIILQNSKFRPPTGLFHVSCFMSTQHFYFK